MPNTLLSSVGRRVELVRSFRAAYSRLGLLGTICGTDIDWLAPAFQEVDEAHLVPPYGAADYLPSILEVCGNCHIDVIFPLNDGELAYLAQHRPAIEATGARLAVVGCEQVKICGDKWETFQFFRRLGLPAPASWLPQDLPPAADLQYPLFIKPRGGSAGVEAFQVRSQQELEFFVEYLERPIVQEFLPGPEITTDVVCNLEGAVMAIASRQRIAVRGGEAIKSVTIHDDRIEQACRDIAQQLPAGGPITVQCMLSDGVPHFIEINARLGGGIPLTIAAGVDVPGLLLADLAGLSTEHLSTEAELGIYMTRCDESFFLPENARDMPASRHLRS